MRGTIAKRLRNAARKVSSPSSVRSKRHKISRWIKGVLSTYDRQTIYYSGYRRNYQDMKAAYKRGLPKSPRRIA